MRTFLIVINSYCYSSNDDVIIIGKGFVHMTETRIRTSICIHETGIGPIFEEKIHIDIH